MFLFGKELYIKKEVIFVSSVFLILCLAVVGVMIGRRNDGVIIVDGEDKVAESGHSDKNVLEEGNVPQTQKGGSGVQDDGNQNQNGDTSYQNGSGSDQRMSDTEEDYITVYVVGCVNNPGLVKIKKGQLVNDAINAAGGPTEDADIYNINLAHKLTENAMIRVKSKNENQASGNTAAQDDIPNSGIEILNAAGPGIWEEGSSQSPSGKVNINTAGIEQLMTLSGIGEQTAKAIIEYRNANGPFISIEDIMKVPGIKESRFSRIRDSICVK